MQASEEAQVFRWNNDKNPMQYGFDFGLWTRQIVQDLMLQRVGVELTLASVGTMLARLGLTAQKPLQRAYQRDPQAVELWQQDTFPAIAQAARDQGVDIFLWMSRGFVLTRSTARPGACVARLQSLIALVNAKASVPRRRSTPRERSGLQPMKVASPESCL